MENYHGHIEVFKKFDDRLVGVMELPKKDGKRRKMICYGDASKNEFEQWKAIIKNLAEWEKEQENKE